MGYVIPTNELTLTDIKNYKQAAINAAVDRAIALGIGRAANELVVREALPATDLGAGVAGATGYNAERYLTGAVAANVWTSVFTTAVVPQLAVTKTAVFYKIADSAAIPSVTAVRFQVGATGATTKDVFFFQLALDNKLESDMYMSQPVVYDRNDWMFITCYARVAIAAGGEELSFGCFIVEPAGSIIS
jgi:hypothetical protein